MAETFEDVARDWHALLRAESAAVFALENFAISMRLAVALLCEQDAATAAAAMNVCCGSEADEQLLLAQVAVLRRLLEIVLREHMSFLLSEANEEPADTDAGGSAMRRAELTRRQAVVASLPTLFRQPFRVLLRENWEALREGVEGTKLSFPRLEGFHWAMSSTGSSSTPQQKSIVVRLQTSDGATRSLQLPLRQFHQLRHSAATVLQEMNQVEAHPMMRLTHMEQSSRGTKEPRNSTREERLPTGTAAASEAP